MGPSEAFKQREDGKCTASQVQRTPWRFLHGQPYPLILLVIWGRSDSVQSAKITSMTMSSRVDNPKRKYKPSVQRNPKRSSSTKDALFLFRKYSLISLQYIVLQFDLRKPLAMRRLLLQLSFLAT
mmetsp:Transcript_3102/g.7229  ORF Transcript_3102/g.7229 Transcript_3102/m.7229 type:complete len:125 (-) Transcript_3102:295-669(-)